MSELKSFAVALLSRREYSRMQLQKKLAAIAKQGEDLEVVLNQLAENGLQSDMRYACSYINRNGARLGRVRLSYDLRQHGIAEEMIKAAMEESGLEDELTCAGQVLAKKFAAKPTNARDWARQARFLRGRGFSAETIQKALKGYGVVEAEEF